MEIYTFLLANDNPACRQHLRRLVEAQPGWVVVAEAGDGAEAVRLAADCQPEHSTIAAMANLPGGDEPLQQPPVPLRVLLADDHPVVRTGLRNELARHPDIEVIGEAVNGDEALHLAETLQPDVLVLDLAMPGLKPVQVIRRLRARPAPPHILVLTAHGDKELVQGMLQAGATGYLLKDEDPAAIVDGVRAVAQGRPWLSPAVAESLAGQPVGAEKELVAEKQGAPLSVRELAVLRLLASGKTDQEIGRKLGIAERTVRYRLRNIYDKLGVNSRVEAVAWAVKQGLTGE
ncbi:MAG: response regulator transcription factor [Anaerolineales bacterium]|nr:response regulator transcription factor [Anaerolineales bacterium]